MLIWKYWFDIRVDMVIVGFFLNNVKKCGYNINYNLFLNIKVE